MSLNKQERQALKECRWVKQMSQQEGWEQVLKPFLEDKVKHSWLDPRKVKSQDKFFYEYCVSWGFAQASNELLRWVESKVSEGKALEQKRLGKTKTFNIGG